MAFNLNDEIEKIYNAKVGWNNSTTDEDRKKYQSIADTARNTLVAYGYKDVADQLSASGADATTARKVMESYAPKTRTKETFVNEENENLNSKLNDSYDYVMKTNPFKTDEAQAILGKYSLAGLNARDNAVASGGASNGGNIDSYAAANAMRQQASMINQGQMVVLDSHNKKIENIRGLLSDMGVHIDRVFNQDETAKNNEVARLSEQASVTGYVPKQWQYSNNPYFNSDGTLNEVYTSKEFDSTGGFTTIINNAKAKLATTTNAEERANLEATIKYATQAKAYKTLKNPQYAQYAHEVEAVTPDRTAEYDTNLKGLESAERISKGETDAAVTMNDQNNKTNLSIADKNNSTQLAIADKEMAVAMKQIEAALAEAQTTGDYSGVVNNMRSHFATDQKLGVQAFISDVLLPSISGGNSVDESDLAVLLKQNATNYGITKEDAKVIGFYFGIDYNDDEWLKGYTFPTTNNYNKKVVEGVTQDGTLFVQ